MKTSPRVAVYRAIFLFGGCNSLLFLVNAWNYLSFPPVGALEILFRYTAFLAHFFLFGLLLSFFLCLLFLLFRSIVLIKIFSVFVFSLAQLAVFVDIRVYAQFKFHLSGIVLGAMTTPGYWDSVHFSTFDWAVSSLALAGLLAVELVFLLFLLRRLKKRGLLWRTTSPRRVLAATGLIVFLALAEKASFGVADFYSYTPVTRYEKVFPLYRPLTFKRILARHLGIVPEFDHASARLPDVSRLEYPLPGFRYHRLSRPRNVLIILVESLRFDMLNEEVTPNLIAFSRQATTALNHFSGGCTSRFGTFALFYGLYGTYWHQILDARKGPVLIGQLLHNDYIFKVMSSTSFSFPEFNRTVFVDLETELDDKMPGDNSAERDKVLVDRWLKWLGEVPPGQPFFSFLFLDAPHSPYNFPEEFKKFEPCLGSISFLRTNLEEDREEIFNRYRNSIHYADHSVGRILQGLEEGGFLENTVVVITGDHGQEFWEHGYYGHNASYTDYQVRVPLLIRVPGEDTPRKITGRTSHLDVPGTILRILGDENDPALYTLGEDLFHPAEERALVLAGWDDCCLVTPAVRLRFSVEAYNILESEAVDNQYRPLQDRDLIRREKERYLLSALEKMGRFMK